MFKYLGTIYHKQTDILILPPKHQWDITLSGGLSTKLFEYMSTKIPVLAIGHPSITSIASGTIFLSKNDVDEFATKIKEICEKSEADFDFESMNKVAENYSYTNRSKKYFREVINGTQ